MHKITQWLRDWLPRVSRSNDESLWCGPYLIVQAPPHVSRWMGRGEIGLEIYRWTKHG